MAKRYGLTFVKTNHLIKKKKSNFNDICHLTDAGALAFVEVIGPEVVNIILN